DDSDKLGGENMQVGALQDARWQAAILVAAHLVADAPDLQFDIANAPNPGERGTIKRQLEWADIDAVTDDQGASAAHAFTIHKGAVGASEVAQHSGPVHNFKRRVTERDVRMVQHDLPGHRLTADSQAVTEGQLVSRPLPCPFAGS